MENATDVIAWCKHAGYRTGIITNGPSGMQRAKLKSLGLESSVDVVLVSGEEGMHKPAAELFHRAAQRLGVDREPVPLCRRQSGERCRRGDWAGMHAIWLKSDMAWPGEMPRPAHSIRSLGALLRILHRHSAD